MSFPDTSIIIVIKATCSVSSNGLLYQLGFLFCASPTYFNDYSNALKSEMWVIVI